MHAQMHKSEVKSSSQCKLEAKEFQALLCLKVECTYHVMHIYDVAGINIKYVVC